MYCHETMTNHPITINNVHAIIEHTHKTTLIHNLLSAIWPYYWTMSITNHNQSMYTCQNRTGLLLRLQVISSVGGSRLYLWSNWLTLFAHYITLFFVWFYRLAKTKEPINRYKLSTIYIFKYISVIYILYIQIHYI